MAMAVAACAMAEVARPLRFLNGLFGLWLAVALWLVVGAASQAAMWNDVACSSIIIALRLPRGRRSTEHYSAWGRYVVCPSGGPCLPGSHISDQTRHRRLACGNLPPTS